jgi:hypothetical protein
VLAKSANIVSIDDHIVEHRHVWSDRLPGGLEEHGRRVVPDNHGVQQGAFRRNSGWQSHAGCRCRKDPIELGTDLVTPDGTPRGCEKLASTYVRGDAIQYVAHVALDLAGAVTRHPHLFLDQFLTWRRAGIYGGTSQVQRNIIAERILGMPTR